MSELDGHDLDAPVGDRDPLGILATADDSVAHFDAARADAEQLEIPYPPEAIRNVAVCGMGGSAIAADLVAGAYQERLRVPMATIRDYNLPGWVGEDTLVILSSHSGTTEETLTAAMQATERGALCLAFTSGGKLAERYGAEDGVPVLRLPGGLQPRAALLRSLVPLVVTLERAGVLPPLGGEIDEARAVVETAVATLGHDVPAADNPAKQLAGFMRGHLPFVWGGELTAPVAVRWRSQINENAKLPALASTLPELDHNEICAFEGLEELGLKVRVIMLRDPRQHRQVQRRMDLTRALVEPLVADVIGVSAEGSGALARMLDLVMLGDYASIHLALARGVDPGEIAMIHRLKESLATTPYGRTAPAEGS
jgi:glucose/mannose-6-phosphate isomerase